MITRRQDGRGVTRAPSEVDDLRAPLVVLVAARPESRQLLSEYMLWRGAVPIPAPSGAHAEVVCQALSPDLVLIDAPLPDADAIAVIQGIRARRPRVPISVCTAPDPEEEARYRRVGVNEIITKPVDRSCIDRVLSRLAQPSRRAP
jgi:CheY-like chemotaxis protein